MRYSLTESEALLINRKFNFGTLLGLNVNQRVKPMTESALKKKGIIDDNNGKEELRIDYRALFSNWEKMRFSVVRPELNDRTHLQCLLSNEKTSIFFARKKDILTLDVFDFSEERFDKALMAFAEIEEVTATDSAFVLSMTVNDYERFIVCQDQKEFIEWKRKTGIDASLLARYVKQINTKGMASMLLVEDHVGDCGYLAKLVNAEDGVYAVKHVTHRENQKMILIYGSTWFVVDSIYNF